MCKVLSNNLRYGATCKKTHPCFSYNIPQLKKFKSYFHQKIYRSFEHHKKQLCKVSWNLDKRLSSYGATFGRQTDGRTDAGHLYTIILPLKFLTGVYKSCCWTFYVSFTCRRFTAWLVASLTLYFIHNSRNVNCFSYQRKIL